jgi:hypothetical protein
MRLSSKKAAYVVVDESIVVGNPSSLGMTNLTLVQTLRFVSGVRIGSSLIPGKSRVGMGKAIEKYHFRPRYA